MDFIELKVQCAGPFREILMAELSGIGFDTFEETDDGFSGYITEGRYKENEVKAIFDRYQALTAITFSAGEVERKNWNEEWEKNYDPIIVDERLAVRATFHDLGKKFPLEIIINPKMSFGTGHHATTHLMMRHQLELDHQGKTVVDIGCGTGILAILAHKLGAKDITAFDNYDWAVENSRENCELNNCTPIDLREGTIADFSWPNNHFDIALANITRNVLLEEMPSYTPLIKPGGQLLLSGFYEKDLDEIQSVAGPLGLVYHNHLVKKEWTAVRFDKTAS